MKINSLPLLFLAAFTCLLWSCFLSSVKGTLSKEETGIFEEEGKILVEPDEERHTGSDIYSKKYNMGDNVYQKDLVKESFDIKAHLKHNEKMYKGESVRNFAKLGYITPWNNAGYRIARKLASKFTHLSPVWLQLKPKDNFFSIFGDHEIDLEWMEAIREKSKGKTKILPRIIIEEWNGGHFVKVFEGDGTAAKKLSKVITETCKAHNFDGIVLESIYHIVKQSLPSSIPGMQSFFKLLSKELHAEKMELILAVAPATNGFTGEDFDELAADVDYFSIMTYDFSNPNNPGPNSPRDWVIANIAELTKEEELKPKILMGLNFYGNDFTTPNGGGPIIGWQFVDMLKKKDVNVAWEATNLEHVFTYVDSGQEHVVYFPTLKSIHDRLELAERLGTGIAIWEIGQGLNYFYDLL
eukprot:Nk52_evm10s1401 gene=Nk52_evmTU10s1401